jgi:hypothetical protein
MARIRFEKNGQSNFIREIIRKTSAPSLRGLLQFGLDTTYTNLKNYNTERRLLPKKVFTEMCYLANINPASIKYEEVEDSWGMVKGGKIGKRD